MEPLELLLNILNANSEPNHFMLISRSDITPILLILWTETVFLFAILNILIQIFMLVFGLIKSPNIS